ncbi:tripartite tricarboxylate transporter substrate-binding protein [Ideonella sp. DXS22W]|uniref:Tripartite tricarboxylate transporter substrate-binding protein n=1 Tax=Pseudaquabacterium inlustre TaxID=2984192 RepID=A0ABU9CKJ0_9BURK
MHRRTLLTALAASGLTPAALRAQAFPSGPLRLVVPYPAGGGIDAVARYLAQGLGEELKQVVNVENKGGAGGTLGADAAAKAPADGHTLLLAGNPELTIAPALFGKLPYAPLADFTPLVLVAQSPSVLVSAPLSASGARTLREALAAAGKRGGIPIGTPGNGSPQHLAVELLRAGTGLDIVHVPYKGAAPATLAALSGETAFALVGAPPTRPHLASGKLQAWAVTQARRSPLLPEVPTLREALGSASTQPGSDEDLVAWYGLLAPARTPADVAQRLERAALAVLARSEARARLAALGTDDLALPAKAFAERMKAETQRSAELIKRFGIKPD